MTTPKYLSVSGLKNYLSCPNKYLNAQILKLRLIVPKAYFAFGKAVHKGIERRISLGLNPISVFQETWEYEKAVDLKYGSRESHQSLKEMGSKMLQAWEEDVTTQELISTPAAVEVPLATEVAGVPLYGIVDFYSLNAVVDWKTASSDFGEEKSLDLQLPFYSLLTGNPELLYGFGVLIKNKTPRVQYVFLPQGDIENIKNIRELIVQAWEGIWKGISTGIFPRIPSSTCSFCDYLPLCLGKEGAEELYASALEVEEVEV